ncbi:transglutaminase-like putative cysteine protease [Epilithonimonas arachidiradicis]|nr:transglutaminase-like putative cysteine protease [Epilithonimonas arachidiradicis]
MVLMSIKTFSQNYAVSEIPEDLKKDANAVIRNISSHYIINSQNDMEINEKKVISILNSPGEKYSYVYIPYDRSRKVSDIKIKVYNEFGKQIKTYSKSDLNDIGQSDDSALYTDDRALYLKISNTLYPYTLDVQFTTNTSNTIFLPTLTPFYDYNVSVQNREIEILNKSGIKLRKKNIENSFAKAEFSGDDNNLKVSYKNIPAIKEEKYAPSMSVVMPRCEFALDQFNLEGKKGNFTSWEEFGKWYNTLLEPVSQITPEIQQEVNALNLQGSTEEKVKKIYQYMQSKTRYVNVAIGIGGWQPMSADNVRKKGYGDCKALTNYMRVLLKAAGIPSYYSIIYMDETSKIFDKDFPKMDGNHVVLCVPTDKGNIWLENTSQKIAFDHLGYRTLDRNVMMVKDNTVEIVETPKTASEKSKEIIRVKATLSENNTLDVLSKFSYHGNAYDVMMPLLYMTPIEANDAMKHRYDNLQFKTINLENLNNDRDKANIDFDFNFKAENYSKSLGSDIYFRAVPFLESDFYLESSDRRFPVEIPFGFTDDYEIEYTIPQNYKFSELAAPVRIDSEFGNYSLEFIIQDKKLLVKRKFMLKKGLFSSDKISEYIQFRKQTNKIDNTKILITKL